MVPEGGTERADDTGVAIDRMKLLPPRGFNCVEEEEMRDDRGTVRTVCCCCCCCLDGVVEGVEY